MVFVLAINPINRIAVEQAIVAEFGKNGIRATSSADVFGAEYDSRAQRSEVVATASKTASHALVMTLIHQDTREGMIEPESYFGVAYNGMYEIIADPMYYRQDKIYVIENNLYQLSNEKVIWSAVTDTVNPATIENGSRDLASVITRQLKKDMVN